METRYVAMLVLMLQLELLAMPIGCVCMDEWCVVPKRAAVTALKE
jgi:hypothetical protein